jgi:hypothetical protein
MGLLSKIGSSEVRKIGRSEDRKFGSSGVREFGRPVKVLELPTTELPSYRPGSLLQ